MSLDEAKEHLQEFFDDKSRTAEDTLEGLYDLQVEIETMIEALTEDLANG